MFIEDNNFISVCIAICMSMESCPFVFIEHAKKLDKTSWTYCTTVNCVICLELCIESLRGGFQNWDSTFVNQVEEQGRLREAAKIFF